MMGDRFLFILLIFFIIAAVFVYDRYMIETRGLSPISQFIDFAGLAEINEWDGDVSDVVKINRKTTINLDEHLFRINEKNKAIAKQRSELVTKRRQILQQLTNINEDMREAAKPYLTKLSEEKVSILDSVPKSFNFGEFLIEVYNLESKDERLAKYQQEKIRLLNRYQELFESDNPEVDKLKKLFQKVESIGIAHEDPQPYGCRRAETCLRKNALSIEKELDLLYRRFLSRPKQSLDEFLDSIRILNYENNLLLSNFSATEDKIQSNNYKIETRFDKVVEKIESLNEQLVIDVVAYYDSIDRQQSYLTKNLLANLKRIQQKYPSTYRDMKHLIDVCDYYSDIDFTQLAAEFEQSKEQTKELIMQLKANEDQMLFLRDEEKYGFESFMDMVIKKVGVYVVSDEQKQIAKKRASFFQKDSGQSPMLQDGGLGALPAFDESMSPQEISNAIKRQRDRQRELNRDFIRLRDKIRDQSQGTAQQIKQ